MSTFVKDSCDTKITLMQYLIYYTVYKNRYSILVWQFFIFSTFNMLLHCLLTSMVSDEMLWVDLTGFPCMWWVIFVFAPFRISSFSLNILSMMCLGVCVSVFIFILLRVHWSYWMCRIFFINLPSFQPLFLHYFLSLSHISWYSHYVHVGALNGVSHFSWLCSFVFILFSLCSSDLIVSTDLSLNLLILLQTQVYSWVSLGDFSFQLLYF